MVKYLPLADLPVRGNSQSRPAPGRKRAPWWEDALATPSGFAYEVKLNGKDCHSQLSNLGMLLRSYDQGGKLRIMMRGTRLFIVNEVPTLQEVSRGN